jgi:hypothetical protein
MSDGLQHDRRRKDGTDQQAGVATRPRRGRAQGHQLSGLQVADGAAAWLCDTKHGDPNKL